VQLSSRATVNFLLNYRLQWGKRDILSLLPSALDEPEDIDEHKSTPTGNGSQIELDYFQGDIPFHSDLICIIQNDWPYSGTMRLLYVIRSRHSFSTIFSSSGDRAHARLVSRPYFPSRSGSELD